MKLKDNSKILIVDADTILFRGSKALEKSYIEVEYKKNNRKKQFKNITEFRGRKKTEVGGWLGEVNKERQEPFLLKDFSIENITEVVLPDSVAHKVLRNRVKEMQEFPWVKDMKWVIGGKDNFRYKVFNKYKKNRPPKPKRFLEIKKWFCEEFKDIVIIANGKEADDVCTYYAQDDYRTGKERYVIGGIDKDLLQVPGMIFYNYDKDTLKQIDEFEAHYNLCIQTITGDRVDGIDSVPIANQCVQERYPIGKGSIGKVKAGKILKGCGTPEELYREVEELYICYYKDDYKQHLNKTYRLVKLLEFEDQWQEGKWLNFPFTK